MMSFDVLLLGVTQSISPLFIGERIFHGAVDLLGGLVLFVIGILIIAFIVAAAIVLLPAILVAALVWFLTGSFFYAGVAFLVIALISIVAVADH